MQTVFTSYRVGFLGTNFIVCFFEKNEELFNSNLFYKILESIRNRVHFVEKIRNFIKNKPVHEYSCAIDALKMEKEGSHTAPKKFKSVIRKKINWYLEK